MARVMGAMLNRVWSYPFKRWDCAVIDKSIFTVCATYLCCHDYRDCLVRQDLAAKMVHLEVW